MKTINLFSVLNLIISNLEINTYPFSILSSKLHSGFVTSNELHSGFVISTKKSINTEIWVITSSRIFSYSTILAFSNKNFFRFQSEKWFFKFICFLFINFQLFFNIRCHQIMRTIVILHNVSACHLLFFLKIKRSLSSYPNIQYEHYRFCRTNI